jgi:hypothetical protein
MPQCTSTQHNNKKKRKRKIVTMCPHKNPEQMHAFISGHKNTFKTLRW